MQKACWSLFWKKYKLGPSRFMSRCPFSGADLRGKCTPKTCYLSKMPVKFLKIRVKRFRHICLLLSYLTSFPQRKNFLPCASMRISELEKSSCHFQASVQWFEAEQRLTKGFSLDSSHHIYHLPLHQTFIVFGCLRA